MMICPRVLTRENSGAGAPTDRDEDEEAALAGREMAVVAKAAAVPWWKNARRPRSGLETTLFGGEMLKKKMNRG